MNHVKAKILHRCSAQGKEKLRESSHAAAADRFSDVVSTSDDGDRYGMMPVAVMGVGPVGADPALAGAAGADAAYEMEDADDVVMDAGGLPHGPHGPLNPVLPPPPLPLPPPRGVPPMVPHGPMPPHPGFQHQRRFSNGTYYDALPLRELEHHHGHGPHRHPPPPGHHHHPMGRLGRGHPNFSSAASDTSSAAGFGPRGGGGGGYYGGRRTYREENDLRYVVW